MLETLTLTHRTLKQSEAGRFIFTQKAPTAK